MVFRAAFDDECRKGIQFVEVGYAIGLLGVLLSVARPSFLGT